LLFASNPAAWLKAETDAAARLAAPDRNSAKDTAIRKPLERTNPHGDAESPAIQGCDANGSEGKLVDGEGDQSRTDQDIETTSASSAPHSFPCAARDDGSASTLGKGANSIPSSDRPRASARQAQRATDGQAQRATDGVEKPFAPSSPSETAVPQDHLVEDRARSANNEHDIPEGKSNKDGHVRPDAGRAAHGETLSKAKGDNRSKDHILTIRKRVFPTPHAPAESSGQRLTAPRIPTVSPHAASGMAVAGDSGIISAQQNDGIASLASPDSRSRILAVQTSTGLSFTMASSNSTAASASSGPNAEVESAGQPDQPSLRRAATDLVGMGGGTVSVTLRPPTLGLVRLQMTIGSTGATHIQLTAATQSGYAALTAAAPALAQHLANTGIAIGSLRTAMQGDSGHGQPQQEHRHRGGPSLELEHFKDDRDDQVLGYA